MISRVAQIAHGWIGAGDSGMARRYIANRTLRVLVCESDQELSETLKRVLLNNPLVAECDVANSISTAKHMLRFGHTDIVFLDFFGIGCYESSDLIFALRKKSAGVVFVLLADDTEFSDNSSFFFGERRRLLHYYRLARHLQDSELASAVHPVVVHCMMDLGMSADIKPE